MVTVLCAYGDFGDNFFHCWYHSKKSKSSYGYEHEPLMSDEEDDTDVYMQDVCDIAEPTTTSNLSTMVEVET